MKSKPSVKNEILKVVLDTNVILSGCLNTSNTSRSILNELKSESFRLIASFEILQEIIGVLSRPKFALIIDKNILVEIISLLKTNALIVSSKRKLTLCRDPFDNMFLEATLAGKADFIVSGDKDLLSVKDFSVPIIKTKDFLQILRERE